MFMIALIGLAVNVASIAILHDSHKNGINVRSVFYHMVADTASSIGIVLAAIVIMFTSWNIIDPLISVSISLIIIYWSFGLLKESTRVLLEMAPPGMNTDIINLGLKTNFPETKKNI